MSGPAGSKGEVTFRGKAEKDSGGELVKSGSDGIVAVGIRQEDFGRVFDVAHPVSSCFWELCTVHLILCFARLFARSPASLLPQQAVTE